MYSAVCRCFFNVRYDILCYMLCVYPIRLQCHSSVSVYITMPVYSTIPMSSDSPVFSATAVFQCTVPCQCTVLFQCIVTFWFQLLLLYHHHVPYLKPLHHHLDETNWVYADKSYCLDCVDLCHEWIAKWHVYMRIWSWNELTSLIHQLCNFENISVDVPGVLMKYNGEVWNSSIDVFIPWIWTWKVPSP